MLVPETRHQEGIKPAAAAAAVTHVRTVRIHLGVVLVRAHVKSIRPGSGRACLSIMPSSSTFCFKMQVVLLF